MLDKVMISFDDALNILESHALDLGTESVLTEHAAGRILTETVTSNLTQPPFDSSAMDGYAVKLADVTSNGAQLKVIGEAAAGKPYSGVLSQGEAIRIFTGSVVPEGAETIIIQENVTRQDDAIIVNEPQLAARHIRRAGQDFSVGQNLVRNGTLLTPAHIALISAANVKTVCVKKKPKIALLCNGDELLPVGSKPHPGQIINSNGPALKALFESWGCDVTDLGIMPDHQDRIVQAISQAKDADVIIPIGGASVGDHDYMKSAFAQAGFKTFFSKVAVRPGKPTWLASRGAQCVLGLPGNPASAFVCARLFAPKILGLPRAQQYFHAALSESLSANGPRTQFIRANAKLDKSGQLRVSPFPSQDSALIHPLADGNVLIKREPNADALKEGDIVKVLPVQMGTFE